MFHTRCHGNNIDDDDYYDQDDDLHVRVYSRKNDKTYLVETMLLRMLLLFVVVVVIQFLRPFVVTCSPNVPDRRNRGPQTYRNAKFPMRGRRRVEWVVAPNKLHTFRRCFAALLPGFCCVGRGAEGSLIYIVVTGAVTAASCTSDGFRCWWLLLKGLLLLRWLLLLG